MAANEVAEQASHMWKQLDAMYAKSPDEYRDFMSKLNDEAESQGIVNPLFSTTAKPRPVRGKYCLRCAGTKVKGSNVHYINVCESTNIKKARVEDRVTVVVSKARRDKEEDGTPYNVYDAVVHTSIITQALQTPHFKRDLLELAIGCIEESFKISLNRTGMKVTTDTYKGGYGWDAYGRALDVAVNPDDKSVAAETISKMTTTSLLTRIQAEGDEEKTVGSKEDSARKEEQLPNLIMPTNAPPPTQQKKGLIQELDGVPARKTGTAQHSGLKQKQLSANLDRNDEDVGPPRRQPQSETTRKDGVWVLETRLPGVNSAADILAELAISSITVLTREFRLVANIPGDAIADAATCRYYPKFHVLQIACPTRDNNSQIPSA
ncbi:hypothetical protein PhCBS80983_g05398 [Powellomyces hirtus]|uniref:PIH1 N-terminal domain-containing protein n=1 Tax=Powellomyces hirtus TaxID=109895 RepID=A0A507DWV1_9FUNG|nr:hypothetical protein PhCBS80983_g05398 [Powellomyces hirtus]